MKFVIAICVLFCLSFVVGDCPSGYQVFCPLACNATNPTCPQHSSCIGTAGSNAPSSSSRCVCGQGYQSECSGNCVTNTLGCTCTTMNCAPVTSASTGTSSTGINTATSAGSTGSAVTSSVSGGASSGANSGTTGTITVCGVTNPNGCPSGTACCTQSGSTDLFCACPQAYYFYSTTLDQCTPKCYAYDPNSNLNSVTAVCECNTGYMTTDSPTTASPFVTCQSSTGTVTCDTEVCTTGTACSNSNGETNCIPTTAAPTCANGGVTCPDTTHWVCVDTANAGSTCRCASGYGGIACLQTACSTANGDLVCGANAQCVAANVGANSAPYCVCNVGWSGASCDQDDATACLNVVCSDPNSACTNGSCACNDGYQWNCDFNGESSTTYGPNAGTTVSASCSCQPVNSGPCLTTNKCTGNYVCVPSSDDSSALCVCPADQFGGSQCNKPRCTFNTDCQGQATSAYCVNNTNNAVPPYCTCPPNSAGASCQQTPTCTSATCGMNRVCNNIGLCDCAPGWTGIDCNDTATCRDTTVYLSFTSGNPLSSTQVSTILASFVRVDITAVSVTGPVSTSDKTVFQYDFKFCTTADVNCTKSYNDFNNNQNSAKDAGLTVTNAPAASGASTLVASIMVLLAMIFAVLL